MAVRIRLQRRGCKKRPFYMVVAADQDMPRDGRFLEKLGTYDPLKENDPFSVNPDRVNHWLKNGATPSDRVAIYLRKQGLLAAAG
ncbi:MAG: 30S ribosomal protein S16 [Magnetococcales bacterium]|nr:30S ribosomal protein S16 [Magnetococcales bacterium]